VNAEKKKYHRRDAEYAEKGIKIFMLPLRGNPKRIFELHCFGSMILINQTSLYKTKVMYCPKG
jgi:hypothetical protein